MGLNEPRSRPLTSLKIWYCRELNPDLWICSQELWPLDDRVSLISLFWVSAKNQKYTSKKRLFLNRWNKNIKITNTSLQFINIYTFLSLLLKTRSIKEQNFLCHYIICVTFMYGGVRAYIFQSCNYSNNLSFLLYLGASYCNKLGSGSPAQPSPAQSIVWQKVTYLYFRCYVKWKVFSYN
jgi:hypothetical protein